MQIHDYHLNVSEMRAAGTQQWLACSYDENPTEKLVLNEPVFIGRVLGMLTESLTKLLPPELLKRNYIFNNKRINERRHQPIRIPLNWSHLLDSDLNYEIDSYFIYLTSA